MLPSLDARKHHHDDKNKRMKGKNQMSPKSKTNKKFVAKKEYRDNYDSIFSKNEKMMDINPEALLITDYDRALIGFGSRCGQPIIAVYDREILLEILIDDGMAKDEADQYICYNIEGYWHGENTPIIFERFK